MVCVWNERRNTISLACANFFYFVLFDSFHTFRLLIVALGCACSIAGFRFVVLAAADVAANT